MPSLDDWEKDWNDKTADNGRRVTAPKLLPVDFRTPFVSLAQAS